MRNVVLFMILIASILVSGYSCQSLLEKDVSKDPVVLLSPPNGSHSDVYNQLLWWTPVEGASAYNLQVVSPSFENIERLVLDTNISQNQFSYTFTPDTFTWRVRAFNAAYETIYAQGMFVIDSTEKPQPVNLISPVDNNSTNDTSLIFTWSSAANAVRYNVLIYKEEVLLYDLRITESTSVTFPDAGEGLPQITDGVYYWQVRSESVLANSEYSAQRMLEVDLTAPETPVIISPAVNDSVSDFKVSWKHPDNSGTAIRDSLIIYRDSTGTNEYYSQYAADTVYEEANASEGWYQYKVKSVDKAENESDWSVVRRFYFRNEE